MFGHHIAHGVDAAVNRNIRSDLFSTLHLPSPPDTRREQRIPEAKFSCSHSDGNLRCFNRCGWKIEPVMVSVAAINTKGKNVRRMCPWHEFNTLHRE